MARGSNFVGEIPIGYTTSNLIAQNENYKQCGIGTMLKRSDYPELSAMYPYNCDTDMYKTGMYLSKVIDPKFTGSVSNVFFIKDEFFILSVNGYRRPPGISITKDFIKYEFIYLPNTYISPSIYPTNIIYVEATSTYSLILSNGKTFYSNNGRNWIESTTSVIISSVKISNNATNGIIYLATAEDTTTASYAYTTDGIKWSTGTFPTANKWNIAYENGYFLAVAGSASTVVYKSTDGLTWTSYTTASFYATGLTSGNGKFYAVGSNSYINSSTDGITWTQTSASLPGSGLIYNIKYLPEGYLLVQYSGVIYIFDTNYAEIKSVTTFTVAGLTAASSKSLIARGNGLIAFLGFNVSNYVNIINFPLIEPDYIPLVGPITNYIRVK